MQKVYCNIRDPAAREKVPIIIRGRNPAAPVFATYKFLKNVKLFPLNEHIKKTWLPVSYKNIAETKLFDFFINFLEYYIFKQSEIFAKKS